ncbi:FkbM family methyltransferase [uncultured Selenomonas sp.]|uniref:FkbM family methyltransferase n=1 Tax=uncultured Selenomonas sp. TaxID=159275 RepID=UPI0028DB9BD0|nr:FkbM family methyltransferase [uncultured Selenomonas sp.]
MNPAVYEMLSSAATFYRFLKSKKYREYWLMNFRYGSKRRFQETLVTLDGTPFLIPDVASFLSTYRELIYCGAYAFESKHERPVILDFGANIGLSLYFWMKNYPQAKVYGYEADPFIFKYLERNVQGITNGNIKLFNVALSDADGVLHFASNHADGGRVSETGIAVQAVDAAAELNKFETIDMLKIDIEGSERIILPRISPYLERVENIFIEYHSEVTQEQVLPELLQILKSAGFRIFISSGFCASRPLIETAVNTGFDLQLDIFGRRMSS